MRAFAAGVLVAALLTAAPVRAQTGAAPDFSNIEIHSLHVQGSVWMIVGGPFNAAVSIGNDGVLVVDTMVEPLADKFLAEIRKLAGDKPIRYVINTHFHADHTGGNAKVIPAGQSIIAGNFAAQVGAAAANQANVIAHENTQIRMMSDLKPAPPFIAMPTDTFFTEAKAEALLELTWELIGDPAALRALDIGCGTGETDALLGAFGELHGVDDVGRPVAARDEGRPLVDEPVVHAACVVVTDVVPLQELARERRRELGDRIGERHPAPPELTSA